MTLGRCKHFGSCGGCSTAGISYAQELATKQKSIQEKFESFAAPILPIIPCNFPWNYRNKMEFSFSQTKEGKHFLGLMMRSGRGKVITLNECYLVEQWFIEVLELFKKWWDKSPFDAYYPFKDTGIFRTLTLRKTLEKMVILTVSGNPSFQLPQEALAAIVELLRPLCDSLILRVQYIAKKTPTRFEERILYGKGHIVEELIDAERKLCFTIKPSSFFQPNSRQAEKIYRIACAMAALEHDELVFDLYCGTGAIGIFASPFVKKVIGIELNHDACLDARANITKNGITNMEVFEGDVGQVLGENERATTVFVDPPRSGLCPLTIKKLLKLRPKKIIYISCNPNTQEQNVKDFLNNGYRVRVVQPVDQFPHTPHIENIVALDQIF